MAKFSLKPSSSTPVGDEGTGPVRSLIMHNFSSNHFLKESTLLAVCSLKVNLLSHSKVVQYFKNVNF